MAMGLTLPLGACGPKDLDSDGYVFGEDCDDSDAEVNPSAPEVCDEIDNNCDGVIDSNATDRSSWYADSDGDGFGDAESVTLSCEAPESSVSDNSDCGPSDPDINPDASEVEGDRLDNDCDEMIDEMTCPDSTIPHDQQAVRSAGPEANLKFCTELPIDGICLSPDSIDAKELVSLTVGAAPTGAAAQGSRYSGNWVVGDQVCGPDEVNPESCCYVFTVSAGTRQLDLTDLLLGVEGEGTIDRFFNEDAGATIGADNGQPVHGRPLVIHGSARTATTGGSQDWSSPLDLPISDMTVEQRLKVSELWHRAALYEHASVASFSKFTLELMALGAPPELIIEASLAQVDEVKHAVDCSSVASSFAGRPISPGLLDVEGALTKRTSPRDLMIQTILDGCINETLAAAEAAWLAEQCEIKPIKEILKKIAKDESRHAALGWKTVRWLINENPELIGVARYTFRCAHPETTTKERGLNANDQWLAAFGCVPSDKRASIVTDVWESVITPCATALLDSTSA